MISVFTCCIHSPLGNESGDDRRDPNVTSEGQRGSHADVGHLDVRDTWVGERPGEYPGSMFRLWRGVRGILGNDQSSETEKAKGRS